MNTLDTYLTSAVIKSPDKTAISINNLRLSYSELHKRTIYFSSALTNAGCILQSNICVHLPKSLELYVAIYASLQLGACYVPIEYTIPVERTAYIVKNSESNMLITTFKKIKELTLFTGKILESKNIVEEKQCIIAIFESNKILVINPIEFEKYDSAVNSNKVTGNEHAYILYTSGSTGKPKGVLHSHKSATVFIDWAIKHLALQETDILSQHASISFDLSIFDIFAAAGTRSTLVPVPDHFFGNVAKICQFILSENISVWYSVPSALLRDTGNQKEAWKTLKHSKLRHIIFAGEPIPKGALQQFLEYIPQQCTLHNWYGPTETNVCLHHVISKEDFITDDSIPIGSPCPYAHVKLLARDNSANTEDQTKELLVQSDSTMLGYWDDILQNSSAHEGLYKVDGYYLTGDRVRIGKNGKLYFSGRYDRQIKLNGFRIQLEEVEQTLQNCKGISEAAVLLIKENVHTSHLVAFVTVDEIEKNSRQAILHYCSQKMPSYMLPNIIIKHAPLPRTSRGKLDYNLLKTLAHEELNLLTA